MPRPFRLFLVAAGALAAGLSAFAADAPADAANPHYKQAQQFLETNNPSGAAEEYEAAIAVDPKLVNAHYELGVIYAEKLAQPIGCIYHLQRFLKLAPTSEHAAAAREMIERESEAFAASLPTSSPSGAQMAKLQIENTGLKKQISDAAQTISQLQGQLAQANARPAVTSTPEPATGAPAAPTLTTPVAAGPARALPLDANTGAPAPDATGNRSYTIVKGDSLWKIAHKMYPHDTKNGVDKIQEANKDTLGGKPLKIGQVLIIPQ